MKNYLLLFALVFYITSSFSQECISCEGTTTSGLNSSAIGTNTTADGHSAFASGYGSQALKFYSTAIGFYTVADEAQAIAIGSAVKANKERSVVIGSGSFSAGKYLENNYERSLMVGFNSTNPTLFVSDSPLSAYFDKTGKVGIGNVTSPLTKLHIRADEGELAALFIEPNDFSANEAAKIILGDTNHFIKATNETGIEFQSAGDFQFNGVNAGFGVEEPEAKVHINGDLLFENSIDGIIMKSEDGNCWKGTISNDGDLIFVQIDCETLTSTKNISEPKHSKVFIYPNPTTGEFTVEYTGNKKELRLEVKTMNGLLLTTSLIERGHNKVVLRDCPYQMVLASVYSKKGELISTNKVVIN